MKEVLRKMGTDYILDLLAILLVLISFLFIYVVPNQLMWAFSLCGAFIVAGIATIMWFRRGRLTYTALKPDKN